MVTGAAQQQPTSSQTDLLLQPAISATAGDEIIVAASHLALQSPQTLAVTLCPHPRHHPHPNCRNKSCYRFCDEPHVLEASGVHKVWQCHVVMEKWGGEEKGGFFNEGDKIGKGEGGFYEIGFFMGDRGIGALKIRERGEDEMSC